MASAKSALEKLLTKGQTLNLKAQARARNRRTAARCAPLARSALTATRLATQVNPDIIGGLVVEIGDKYLVRCGAADAHAQSHTFAHALRSAPAGLVAEHAHPQDGAAAGAGGVSAGGATGGAPRRETPRAAHAPAPHTQRRTARLRLLM
jgi:hypothetical protein